MPNIPNIELTNGTNIPQVGFGLWQIKNKQECHVAVQSALEAGYRHFDTAQVYGNEAFLGDSLSKSKIPRNELFITTKISITNFLRAKSSFEKSLINLQTEYVDLLLLHFPVTGARQKAWRDLEDIHAEGKAKSIGVSNYTIRHLKQLLKNCTVKPVVNQVELHVYLEQPELLEYCRENGIVVEAYSPLAHGHGLDNHVLVELAKKHNKTVAQVMLRWCLQVGTVPLPKSVHAPRIVENLDIFDFELDQIDMGKLKDLDANYRTCWDPTNVP